MRKTIIILVSCTVILLLGYSGYRGYQLWQQGHWMSLAKKFAAHKDGYNEFLCLEHVLQLNQKNAEACRMIGNLAEASHSGSALIWRKKVLELDPTSVSDRLALIQTAVLSRDLATAQSALSGMNAADKNTPGYFRVIGELAMASNQPEEAQADFAEAVRLDPSDSSLQMSLAAIELGSTNALDADEGRILLKRLSMNSTNFEMRTEAKRDLIFDALRRKDNSTALSLAKDLAQGANATFADKLLRLDVLKVTQNGDYSQALASCEREAGTNSEELSHLSLWLLERRAPGPALAWLRSLPANVQTNLPSCLLIAQCDMVMQNWNDLRTSISSENWGNMEYTREAYLARALRQQGLYQASKAEWDVALSTANGRDAALTTLFRFAAEWNWHDEAEQILWTIVNSYPQERWASQQLSVVLYDGGSTRPLMQLFSLEAGRNPADLDAKNDLAMTAMLLGAQEMKPFDLARDVYQKAPTNPFYTCTYAFSLYLKGKNADALKLMQHIPPQDLKNNTTAGYYGLILKAAGDNNKASSYLKSAVKGKLLPEERALFQQAMASL